MLKITIQDKTFNEDHWDAIVVFEDDSGSRSGPQRFDLSEDATEADMKKEVKKAWGIPVNTKESA